MPGSLMTRLSSGETLLGAWGFIGDALVAEALARGPVDWVLVDMQHGCMGYERALEMIRAIDLAGKPAIVRVPANDPGTIGRALDAGAAGIIIPMIETVQEARKAVDACLYPPLGRRSFGPVRVGTRDGPGYFAVANGQIAVIPMIETKAALDAVDEIAAVPGVSGLFLGPFDLSVALGLDPGDNDGVAIFDDAVAKLVEATRRHGIAAAIMSNARLAPLRARQGFGMISIFNDLMGLGAALASDAKAVRGALEKEKADA